MKYAEKMTLALVLILTLGMALLGMRSNISGGEPSMMGHGIYIVLSDSMSPAIKTGGIVVVKPVSVNTLLAGDVITFWGGTDCRAVATHRVVALMEGEELAFITKGDANESEDVYPVPSGQVIGKVVYTLPYIGYFLGFVRDRRGMFAVTTFLIALAILPELFGFKGSSRRRELMR